MTLLHRLDAPDDDRWSFPRVAGLFVAGLCVGALILAQIAVPLFPARVAGLSTVVIVTLTLATAAFAIRNWKPQRLAVTLSAVFIGGMGVEMIGVHTGFPFGRYSYSGVLQPQIGGVPLLVGLAWLAMVLPAWELGRRMTPNRFLQCVAAGWGLAIWDVFLDPQMIGNHFWAFDDPQGWQSIVPWTNFFGWFITGTVLATIPAVVLAGRAANRGLAFLYVWMIGFSALGYLIPFALDDPEIGVVGATVAAPFLFFAFRKRDRSWLALP